MCSISTAAAATCPSGPLTASSVYFTAKVGKNVELFQTTLDGKLTQLTKTAEGSLHYHPQLSPDGKSLVYGSLRDGARNIYVMNLADRTEKRDHRLEARLRSHVATLAAGGGETEVSRFLPHAVLQARIPLTTLP